MCLRCWITVGFLLPTALLLATTPLPAAEGGDESARERSLRNGRLICQARRALSRDDTLGSLNLGVSAREGEVVVWGFVLSPVAAELAVEKLRRLPGVVRVRSELQVLSPNDPLADCLNGPIGAPATPLPTLPATLAAPARLTSRWTDGATPLDATPGPEAAPAGTTVMPTLTAPQAAPPVADTVLAAIERLQKSEARYRGIRVEVEAGVVRLSGVVARAEDGMELAQAVSRLPGVQRVSIRDVKVSSR